MNFTSEQEIDSRCFNCKRKYKKTEELYERLKDCEEKIMKLEKNDWISVDKELPEFNVDVLIWDGSQMAVSQYFYVEHYKFCIWEDRIAQTGLGKVTHWMPLPKRPLEK